MEDEESELDEEDELGDSLLEELMLISVELLESLLEDSDVELVSLASVEDEEDEEEVFTSVEELDKISVEELDKISVEEDELESELGELELRLELLLELSLTELSDELLSLEEERASVEELLCETLDKLEEDELELELLLEEKLISELDELDDI